VLDGQGGTTTIALVPQTVGGTDWVDVACGDSATCAIKTDGTRWCGGANEDGELGNGEAWVSGLSAVP
jgi:alpha-tubulin suppressor-like RCC1 family protein